MPAIGTMAFDNRTTCLILNQAFPYLNARMPDIGTGICVKRPT